MDEIISNLNKIAAVIGYVTVILVAYKSCKHWLNPLIITPSIHVSFVPEKDHSISASITNIGKQTLYISECRARSPESLRRIISQIIKNPIKFYKTRKFSRFKMISLTLHCGAPIKIETNQAIELKHTIRRGDPYSLQLQGPLYKIEVTTTDKRTIYSKANRFISNVYK